MITKDFPHLDIFPLAQAESWRKEVYRPIYYGHKWWAKRLGSVFRFIIGTSISENFKVNEFYKNSKVGKSKVILDPFMGSGTTIGESLKLGCKTIGCDINPVSYFMVKTSLQNIDIKELTHYYKKIHADTIKKTDKYYKTTNPLSGKQCEVLYFFWVATLPCNECKTIVPLFNTFIFSKNAYPSKVPKCQIVCPHCLTVNEGNYLEQKLTCKKCKNLFNPHEGNTDRTTFKCLKCSNVSKIGNTVKKSDKAWSYKLYAIMFLDENGKKQYKTADDTDLELFSQAENELKNLKNPLVPDGKIQEGTNTNQILDYNFTEWKQLFNARQLLTLNYLLTSIQATPEPYKEVFLMLFSGLLEFNNMFCSFKGEGTGAVRHMFSHHILKPEKMALENIVIGNGNSSGTFSNLFQTRITRLFKYLENPFEIKLKNKNSIEKIYLKEPVVVKQVNNYEELINNGNLLLYCRDSSSLPIPNKSIDAVITDPPFFDYINYSELADFFYTWIKLAKKDDPAFMSDSSRRKEEVQDNNSNAFLEKLTAVFLECNRVLKNDGLMIFTFHHSTLQGWNAIGQSIHDSGFTVVKTYPVKSEMSASITQINNGMPINIDAVIVCKKMTPNGISLKINVEKEVQKLVEDYNNQGYKLGKGDEFVLRAMKELENSS